MFAAELTSYELNSLAYDYALATAVSSGYVPSLKPEGRRFNESRKEIFHEGRERRKERREEWNCRALLHCEKEREVVRGGQIREKGGSSVDCVPGK